MDSEQVVSKILSEARAEAEKITGQAKSKAEKLSSELAEELSAYKKATEELAVKEAQDKRERMLAGARMDNRKADLTCKVGVLNEVFAEAKEKINSLGDKEYRELMEQLMLKSVETGDEEVIVGKNEKRIDHEFVKQINRKLGSGFKGNLRLGTEKADIDGGFILRRGKVQINVSTDVLLDRIREELEIELATELFKE